MNPGQTDSDSSSSNVVHDASILLIKMAAEQHAGELYTAALLMTGLPEESVRCTRTAFMRVARQRGHQEESAHMKFCLLHHLLEVMKQTPVVKPEAPDLGNSIQNLVLTLDPVYREVIVLRHCLGLGIRDISEVLLLPERKVRSRLSIARQMLHDHQTMREGQ